MEAGELTIDELAAHSGMTVRNIRAHQSRGLLPPPRLVGRTALYGPLHVHRLRQIRRMQGEGLNLAAIAKILADVRLAAVATEGFEDLPEYRTVGEVAARLGIDPDGPVAARAGDMGLVATEGDRIRMELPRLVAIAEELHAQGVPVDAQLDAVGVVQEAAASVAAAFMRLADEHLVTRVALDSGGDLDQLRDAIERLREQAAEVLDVVFNRAMSDEVRTWFDARADPGT